ncbi:hypothetical protein ABE073_04210 [Lederbergia citrisecunda]|uniref:hypothetical protein n=1 Tax=Lederbergia citrisecunda TaxID=2833583 RepID=UPI003D28A917
MLKREVGQFVVVNPYYNTTGTIIDTKDITTYKDFNKNFDYRVKWNQKMEDGTDWQYFNDDELDMLEKNWNVTKANKSIIVPDK